MTDTVFSAIAAAANLNGSGFGSSGRRDSICERGYHKLLGAYRIHTRTSDISLTHENVLSSSGRTFNLADDDAAAQDAARQRFQGKL